MFSKTRAKAVLKAPATGIDIGSRNTRYMVVSQIADRVDIQAAGCLQTPVDWVEDGVVREPKKFGRALSTELNRLEVPVANAVFSVPSNLAVLRWINMPQMPEDELRLAARFRVKRHLPFDVDTAYVVASQPELEDGEDSGASLVIAVPKLVVDSRAEALEVAGLTPVGAELEAQSILRIVERRLSVRSALWRDASMTIIDVGASNTHMYVVQNQRLQFIRGVKFGVQRIARAIAQAVQIQEEDAEDLIKHPETSLNPDGTMKLKTGDLMITVDLEPELERLTREFMRLFRYFRSLHPERSYAGILDHVLVCGGFAGMRGFDQYLESKLDLRVEQARPFAGMVGKFSQDTFESIAGRQEAYTVAVGLALAGLESTTESIGGDIVARREFTWARSA